METHKENKLDSLAISKFGDRWPSGFSIKLIWLLIFAGLFFISILVIAPIVSSPDSYGGMTETLDEKKANVTALMASTTAASAGISLLPGDAGTPIANKLIDLSSYFLVILAIIYAEKFLMTTIGYAVFKFLIPAAFVLLAIALFINEESDQKKRFQGLGIKCATFGLAIFCVIPASVAVSNNIDKSFQESIEAANQSVQETTVIIESEAQEQASEESNFIEDFLKGAQNSWNSVTQGVQESLDSFSDELNTLIDELAVMIVTSCLIPIVVLALFLWLANTIIGLDLGTSQGVFKSGKKHTRAVLSEIQGK